MQTLKPNEFEYLQSLYAKTGLKKYACLAAEDLAILHWWIELTETGDIHKLFAPQDHSLGNLFDMLRGSGKIFFYKQENDRIVFASWFEEIFHGHAAFSSMWTAIDRRGTRFQYDCALTAYLTAFSIWPSLIGVTKQPALLAEHEKLGYSIVGMLPGLFDGKSDTYLVYLTKKAFLNSRFHNVKGDDNGREINPEQLVASA